MLRYDHSEAILNGILGPHPLKDATTGEPLLGDDGKLLYGINIINMPKPRITKDFGEVTFNVENGKSPYTNISTLTLSGAFTFQHKKDYIITWDGIEYLCTAYMSSKALDSDTDYDDDSQDIIYLGNGSYKSEFVDDGLQSWDPNVPFVISTIVTGSTITFYTKDETKNKHSISIAFQPDPTIYMGLFTTEPNAEGENYLEPGYPEKITDPETGEEIDTIYHLWPEYLRVPINVRSRFDDQLPLLKGAEANEVSGYMEVVNQDMILFPEAVGNETEQTGWGKVFGFGLFYGNVGEPDGEIPFLWGKINGIDEDGNEITGVDIGYHEVPVIRKSGFIISLQ